MENLGTITSHVPSSKTPSNLETALDKRADKWTILYIVNIKKEKNEGTSYKWSARL